MFAKREDGSAKLAGKNLHKLRTLHDLSQAGLGKALGLQRSTIANWESGRCLPSELVIDRLQDIFKVERAVLLGKKTLKYELSNVRWTHYKPNKSGTYLAYVRYGGDRCEYLLLDYDHAQDRWEEKTATYINLENGNRVNSFTTFAGEVLQWTSFPPCDYDIAEKTGGKRRYFK